MTACNENVTASSKKTDDKNMHPSHYDVLASRRTPWKSVGICIFLQFIIGIQISIYYMSMWPYLSGMDSSATLMFQGWVVASCSLGCSIANPLFGLWNQRTMSAGRPTILAFVISSAGQLMYGLLPLFTANQKWWMIFARVITGFGAGCLSVLRAYVATASVPSDKLKAISYGTAGWVLGLSFGPAIQRTIIMKYVEIQALGNLKVIRPKALSYPLDYNSLTNKHVGFLMYPVTSSIFCNPHEAAFTPIGEEGFNIGPIVCNMYTAPAFFMVVIYLFWVITLMSCLVLVFYFHEDYAGVLDLTNNEKNEDLPSYDLLPALICIYLWIASSMVSTNIEVISTPFATALYGWKDSTSILYNGIIESVTCIVSVIINVLIGYTRIGKMYILDNFIDNRVQMLFGLVVFLLYHLANYPWFFYPGPLTYIPPGNTTAQIGGCEDSYTWCANTVQVPLAVYLFAFIVFFGVAFPFVGSPSASLYSEIIGPRKQGTMQGLYSLGGSVAQFIAPIISTGYKWLMVTQIATLGVGVALVLIFYRRLVPLKLQRSSETEVTLDNADLDTDSTVYMISL